MCEMIEMIRLSEWIAKDRSSEEIQRQEMIDKLLSSFSVERNATYGERICKRIS